MVWLILYWGCCFCDLVSSEVSESDLLQELIYSFQGVNGKFLKLSPVSQGYKLDPKVRPRIMGVGLLCWQLINALVLKNDYSS